MLKIVVPGTEVFDEESNSFSTIDDFVLELEHSLLSVSKWESEFEKPFLEVNDKTAEEALGYVRAMVLTSEFPKDIFSRLNDENVSSIDSYINRKMTATWFSEAPGAPQAKEIITAEVIYYWMTVFNIPFECETWHLNRLLTLIKVANLRQAKPKKMGRAEAAARQRALNEQRKAQFGTKG